MLIRNYFFQRFRNFLLHLLLFSNIVSSEKTTIKEIFKNLKAIGQQHKKKTVVFMLPISFFMVLLLLRELPHKRSVGQVLSESISSGSTEKIIIFLHGIGANYNRIMDVIKQDTKLWYKLTQYKIFLLPFHETQVNKAFRTSFGQKGDMDQVFNFIKNCYDLKNVAPANITFIAHSRSGQTLLQCVHEVLNVEYDNEYIKKIIVESKKIYVAPLLCLKTTIKDMIKKAYIPNKIADILSNAVCRFCLPFVTKGLYDPTFVPAIEKMQHWNKNYFKNSIILLPEHDELVGNGKTPELIDILYKRQRSDIIHFVENATHDSDNLLQAALEEAFIE